MDISALVLAAPRVDARARSRAAEALGDPTPGVVVLRTCHRLEAVGTAAALDGLGALRMAHRLDGEDAARHVLRVAVGLESTVLAEDQVLHQLRSAARVARARGGLPRTVGHVLDVALRHGRQARSWLPAERPSLADVALERIPSGRLAGATVTVIGRGPMGRGLAHALAARGGRVVQLGRDGAPVPGSRVVAIALAGVWRPGDRAISELAASDAWVVDLSAPPALDAPTMARIGSRLVTIDDLGDAPRPHTGIAGIRLRERLEARVELALGELRDWLALAQEHDLARVRSESAGVARERELEALWRRLPDLRPAQRAEIERMAERLSERLLFGS
jgi:glutamyl-tRNA reductase